MAALLDHNAFRRTLEQVMTGTLARDASFSRTYVTPGLREWVDEPALAG